MTPNLLPFIIANHSNPVHSYSPQCDGENVKKRGDDTFEIDGYIVQVGRDCKGKVVGQIIGRVDD